MIKIVLRAYDEDLPKMILELDKDAIIEETKNEMIKIESDLLMGYVSAEPSGRGHYVEILAPKEKGGGNITFDIDDVYEIWSL